MSTLSHLGFVAALILTNACSRNDLVGEASTGKSSTAGSHTSSTSAATTTSSTGGAGSVGTSSSTSSSGGSTTGFVCTRGGTTGGARIDAGPCVESDLALNGGGFIDSLADLNGDGLVDIAVATQQNCTVEIHLALDAGGFDNGHTVTACPYPAGGSSDVHVADFNGDGIPDLAVGDILDFELSISLGNGDGTFKPFVEYPNAGFAGHLAIGDFNGDGKPDVVTSALALFFGRGDGTFEPAVSLGQGRSCDAMYECSIAVDDVNGDGVPDLVIGETGDIAVLRGIGDGGFLPALTSGSLLYADWIMTLADFNCDGAPDLVFTEAFGDGGTGNPDLVLMLGHGDGTFGAPTVLFTNPVMTNTAAAVVAWDVNGDGNEDLVFTFTGGIFVYLGDGTGHFTNSPLTTPSPLMPSGEDLGISPVSHSPGSPLFYTTSSGTTDALHVYTGTCY